jgi:hypothetical protein
MHRRLVIPVMLMLLVATLAACNPFATHTPTPGSGYYNILATTTGYQVGASNDDSYQEPSTPQNYPASGRLRIGQLSTQDAAVGLRWQNVTVPKNATIVSATVSMYITRTVGSSHSWKVYIEAADSCAEFYASWPLSRTLSTNFGTWTTSTTVPEWKDSPDVGTAVKEIVDRASWASGNSLCAVIIDNQTSANTTQDAESYDHSTTYAAKLWVNYTAPTATPTSTPTATGTNTNTPTVTSTPTNTGTNTPTSTPTVTSTPTNTSTPTATPTQCGRISGNTTWSGTHTLACNLSVASGATLTLDAGTVVQFSGAYYADIQGRVVANGTAASPVLWTRQSGSTVGQWGPLYIVGAGSSMNYVTMTFGIGLSAGAPVTLTHLWAYTNTYGLDLAANASVMSATIRGNSYGVQVRLNAAPTFSVTNVLSSTVAGLVVEQPRDVAATSIWWGTTDGGTIEGYLIDDVDDLRRGRALWSPAAASIWAW